MGRMYASVDSAEMDNEMVLKCCQLLLLCIVKDPPFTSRLTNEKRKTKITYEFSMTENPGLLVV